VKIDLFIALFISFVIHLTISELILSQTPPIAFNKDDVNKTLHIVITKINAKRTSAVPINKIKYLNNKEDNNLITTIRPQKPDEENNPPKGRSKSKKDITPPGNRSQNIMNSTLEGDSEQNVIDQKNKLIPPGETVSEPKNPIFDKIFNSNKKNMVIPAAVSDLPKPEYPRYSRIHGEAGRVILLVYIGIDGKPDNITIAASSGYHRLDKAAVKALKKAHFIPAMMKGKAVISTKRVAFTFNFTDMGNK